MFRIARPLSKIQSYCDTLVQAFALGANLDFSNPLTPSAPLLCPSFLYLCHKKTFPLLCMTSFLTAHQNLEEMLIFLQIQLWQLGTLVEADNLFISSFLDFEFCKSFFLPRKASKFAKKTPQMTFLEAKLKCLILQVTNLNNLVVPSDNSFESDMSNCELTELLSSRTFWASFSKFWLLFISVSGHTSV